ncbi:MAG: transcriptional repressor [Paludibacteraceae bacterium]|nr:transcriptional repressor [Paludibacteraceae bacterium]
MNEPFTAEAYLKAAGITPTLQRTIVMDDLYHNRTHATIEEIYERLSTHYPKVTQRTIYNTINLFVAKGLVSELTIDEKCARYDFDTSVHTHFQCTDCGTIFDVHSTRMRYRLPRGFTLQTEQHCTYGICAACNRKRMQYKL